MWTILLVFHCVIGLGQPVEDGSPRIGKVSVSGMACRMAVRDDAYSSAVYTGWMPSASLMASVEFNRHLHGFQAAWAGGRIVHPSGAAGQTELVQWRFSYRWHYLLGDRHSSARINGGIGAGVELDQMSRSYDGFINGGNSSDRWAVLSLRGFAAVRLDEAGKFGMQLGAGLGILGWFDLGPKLPESNPADAAETAILGMPATNVFDGGFCIRIYYRPALKHSVAMGYEMESTRNEAGRSWGLRQDALRLTYGIKL